MSDTDSGFERVVEKFFEAKLNALRPLPTEKQIEFLRRLGYRGRFDISKDQASALISELNIPSEKQLDLLHNLGYRGDEPETRQEASKLIEKYLGGQ